MRKRFIGIARWMVVAGWISGLHLTAQNNCYLPVACSVYNQLDPKCVPTPPATAQMYTVAPWTSNGTVKGPACAPGPNDCSEQCSNPIDLADGNARIVQTDIKLPGLGGGLSLVRTWNSIWPGATGASAVGMFGVNWSSTFDEAVLVGGDGYMKYSRSAGNVWSMGFTNWDGNGNPQFIVAGRGSQSTTLTQAPTNWTLVLPNGETRVFDGTSGKLLSIADRNGNITSLTYDSSFRLVTVKDPASRHLYFSYASPTSFLVTGVTSDFGVSLSYSYDVLGRLIQYTKPDNTTVSFQYSDNNPNLITAVLDSEGKLLEAHTYNACAQGTGASRANGVESVTVSYPLSCHIFKLSQ